MEASDQQQHAVPHAETTANSDTRVVLTAVDSGIAGEGRIVVEFSDVGFSRTVSPFLRPGSSSLLKALPNPDRGFDAVVIGPHERAFSGNQYSLVAPLRALHSMPLWMPELGGAVDPAIDTVEELMDLLGILARREVVRARRAPSMQ